MAAVAPLADVLERLNAKLRSVVGLAADEALTELRLLAARRRGEPTDRLTVQVLQSRDELTRALLGVRELVVRLHKQAQARQRQRRRRRQ